MEATISKIYKQLLEGKVSKDYFVRRARMDHSDYISSNNTYDDIVTILKGKRLISDRNPIKQEIKEAHDLTITQIIDRINPYVFKKAMEYELSKKNSIEPGDLNKLRDKVANKLKNDPKCYNSIIWDNAEVIEKRDKKLRPKEVKNNSLFDKDNAMRKPKGFQADKANTKDSKKENKKGKPKGVKELTYNAKKTKGIASVLPSTGKEKTINENAGEMALPQKADYTNQEVTINHDPETKQPLAQEKTGLVKRQDGSILYVDFGDGKETAVTINVVNPEPKQQDDNRPKIEEPKEALKIKEIVGKLKDYLSKRKNMKRGIKDEAQEFTVAGKQTYVSDKDAASKEQELRTAGVRFIKRRV